MRAPSASASASASAKLTRARLARRYVPVQFMTQPSLVAEAGRFLPTLLIIGFFYMLSRGMGAQMGGGPGGGLFNVGKSKAVKATKVKTRFDDVAGLKEAKREIMEFVDIRRTRSGTRSWAPRSRRARCSWGRRMQQDSPC